MPNGSSTVIPSLRSRAGSERSEGSLRPSSQTLRGVYPERSEGLRVTGVISKCLGRTFLGRPNLLR
jgi:hypothetical protein